MRSSLLEINSFLSRPFPLPLALPETALVILDDIVSLLGIGAVSKDRFPFPAVSCLKEVCVLGV